MAGSTEKAALAKTFGADHVMIGRGADIVSAVASLTSGSVDFGIDGIGATYSSKRSAA
jgi:NADPH:quinone reductase